MPKVGLNVLALAALVAVCAGAGGGAGCSGKKPTELVPGVSTQIVVPHDLQGVRVTVLADGALAFDQGYNVGPGGTVQLPSTLGVLSAPNPETTVSITIRGYQNPCVGTGNTVSADCSTLGNEPVGNNGPQVLRRSVQTFVDQRILFVPMPISYSCWNNGGCTSDQSCKGNQCVPSTTDSASLVDFDPALLDGTDVCFNPAECFADAVPAQLVDLPTCTYAVPSAPGVTLPPGLNVRIWYEDFLWTLQDGVYSNVLQNGGEVEILNNDSTEGFTLGGAPDAGVGDGGASTQELFQLAPGLCQLAQQATYPPPPPAVDADGGVEADAGTGEYVTISRIEVAPGCPAKPPLLPICQGQQANLALLPGDAGTTPDGVCNVSVNMTPTQSALYLAFDDSQVMNGAYGAMGSATALSVSLSDPVFKRTYAASSFFHQTTSADCTAATTSYESPRVPFGLASTVQSKLANELLTWTAPDPGTGSCSPTGGSDGGGTCSGAGQVCAGTGAAGTFSCVTPDPLDLQAALRLDSGVYGDILQFLEGRGSVNVAAGMFFLNRAPTAANDCNPLLPAPDGGVDSTVTQAIENEISAAFNATPSLKTYFIVLDDDAHDNGSTNPHGALAYFSEIQSVLPDAVTVLDATNTSTMSQAQIVGANFSKIVTQLGTCLYDYGLPAGYSTDEVQIAYQVPGQAKVVIPQDSNCSEANQSTVSGWNFDGGRVRVCGQACSTLQTTILAASAAALNANQPAPDIAVAATVLCAPATGQVSDAGPVADASDGSTLVSLANCMLTCGGCCDTFGNCLTGTSPLACGTGGQTCVSCTGCDDAGVCESTGSADSAAGGFGDGAVVSGDGG